MNIYTENKMAKKERSVMLLANSTEGGTVAEMIAAKLEPKKIRCTLDARPEGGIPWENVDQSRAQYPDFARIAKANPEYILMLELKKGLDARCTVMPYHVEYCTGAPGRDTEESQKARDHLYRALKGIGCIQGPTNGSQRIPYKDVEDFPELREGEQPFLSVRMDSPAGYEAVVAQAIAAGVAAYFGR